MNPSALQEILGLYVLLPRIRTIIEALAALLLALLAIALRRRTILVRPPSLLMIAAGLLCDSLTFFLSAFPNLRSVMDALAIVLVAFGLIRLLVELAYGALRRQRTHFSTIFRDLLMLLLFALVVASVLHSEFKVELRSLLASGAVVTVVLGFALQESLGNIFSGLALQMDRPFEPGDWVRSAKYVGQVRGVGWRSTTVVTLANERLEIPNSLLAKDVLVSYAGAAVADEVALGISYLEPPNRVREIIQKALRDINGVMRHPEPEVFAWEYGDNAIRYRVKYWLADYGRYEEVRDRVTTALWYVLRRNAMEIPFPTRTLELRRTRRELSSERAFEGSLIGELRQVDFLRDLSEEDLGLLSAAARFHQFGAGEVLVHQGDPANSFFILRRGRVEVLARADDGHEARLAELSPPAFFGEIALMTGETRNATVRARSDIQVLEIDREGFTRLFRDHPEVGARMGEVIAARLTERRDILAATPESDGDRAHRNWFLAKMRAVFDF